MRVQLRRLRLTVAPRLVLFLLVAAAALLPACGDGDAAPAQRARPTKPAPVPSKRPKVDGKPLSRVATGDEMALWKLRGCVSCHGKDGEGSTMGPSLAKIIPLYLESEGSAEAAVARLTRYITTPTSEPLLGGVHDYLIPMPNIGAVQGTEADAAALAALLVRWQTESK